MESTMNVRNSLQKQSVLPEMLSPDETAHLIANVMQKISQSQHYVTQSMHHQTSGLNPNMSIASNEEILRQALTIVSRDHYNN